MLLDEELYQTVRELAKQYPIHLVTNLPRKPLSWTDTVFLVPTDPVHGGLKGTCETCPFNEPLNEHAAKAQDYGCLPSAGEIMQMKILKNRNWGCHSHDHVCVGLCHGAKHQGLDMNSGTLYRNGDNGEPTDHEPILPTDQLHP